MTLAEQGIITGLIPIGGWRYPQPFANAFTTIKPEHSPKGNYPNHGERLVAAVRLFRQQHGIKAGEPEKDVAEFIRRASPQNDYYRGKLPEEIGKIRSRPITPLIEEIRGWIEKTVLEKPDLVGNAEAMERAQACVTCKQNRRWQINCSECVKEVEYRGNLLRPQVTFDYDPGLLACRLHKLYLPAAVFIDRDYLPPRHPESPDKCWVPQKQ